MPSLSEVSAAVSFGSDKVREGDRKAMARRLWSGVSEQLAALVKLEERCAQRID